jgi:hypothetical protein
MPPKLPQPRMMRETRAPVVPSLTYSISGSRG